MVIAMDRSVLIEKGRELAFIKRRIARNRDRIAFMRDMLTGIHISTDGQPKGSVKGDTMVDGIACIDELERAVVEDVALIAELQNDLSQMFSGLRDAACIECMELRYVDGLTWPRIAERMNYSIDGIFKLHRRALILFDSL